MFHFLFHLCSTLGTSFLAPFPAPLFYSGEVLQVGRVCTSKV